MPAFLKLEKFDKIKNKKLLTLKVRVNSSNSWLKNTNERIIIVPTYFFALAKNIILRKI